MVFLNGTLLLGLISCCLAVPHRNVGRATTSLIPTSSLSAPTGTPTRAPKIDQKRYSNHVNDFYKLYGWLKPGTSVPDSDLPEAIRKIQAKLKEPVTGEFSEKMLAMMEGPRCGTEQQYVGTGTGEGQESKERYALWGPKWAKMTLTWRIDRYTNDLSQERQLSTIGSVWSPSISFTDANISQLCLCSMDELCPAQHCPSSFKCKGRHKYSFPAHQQQQNCRRHNDRLRWCIFYSG